MLELTPENTAEYLRARQWVGAGPVKVELLGWGVSNAVLRVECEDRAFVLKQSRPQLRTKDAWFSDLNRVYREQEVMEVLYPVLPPLTVPEVLFADRENFVFAMSHAPADAVVWKETLLAGRVDLALAELAGTVLGRMHQATAHDAELAKRFGDSTVFVQLRVDPFYRRVQERRPEAAAFVEPIIQRMLTLKEAVCHGDYTPKNMLTHRQGFTLVDYETAYFGDPTMDLGLFLAHLFLKAVKHYPSHAPFFDAIGAFWRCYTDEVEFCPVDDLQRRGIEHLAVCLLARIDGTSPIDYLPEAPKREAVRRLSRKVLEEKVERWERIMQLTEELLVVTFQDQ